MQHNSIGFIIPTLGPQHIPLINDVNHLHNVRFFVSDLNTQPTRVRVPILQEKEMYEYDGVLVATNLRAANKMLKSTHHGKQYLYVLSLEWMAPGFDYAQLQRIYQHDNIELIAKNAAEYDVITRLWKQPKFTIESFNEESIRQLF